MGCFKVEERKLPSFDALFYLYGVVLFNILSTICLWLSTVKLNKNYGNFRFKIPHITVLRCVYILSPSTCCLFRVMTPKETKVCSEVNDPLTDMMRAIASSMGTTNDP